MSRSITSKLLKAKAKGARIVCVGEPYEGQEVDHAPIMPEAGPSVFPWVLPSTGLRFNGRQVRAEWPEGADT